MNTKSRTTRNPMPMAAETPPSPECSCEHGMPLELEILMLSIITGDSMGPPFTDLSSWQLLATKYHCRSVSSLIVIVYVRSTPGSSFHPGWQCVSPPWGGGDRG
jgi:hypothetical protein